ncbi:MAG: Acetyltransferase [Candidatus Tokpelaia hoelldobleri]|uniref:Acetyltransferase n=1 Tax=Candidatus Tokpelaia hoelldobleri TaxID=1902579 RepID=A0A1U9JUQ9_9HYPH|nr:MAG: Acetyltransferase [Candidatus Tokpelaia hoelldoblerii]
MWLRTASRGDIAAIHRLLVETWHAAYDDVLGREAVNQLTAQWHSADRVGQYLTQPLSEYVVADDGKAICGVAYAVQCGDTVFLHQLYVRPEQQNQGIGKQLLAEIEGCFPAARHIRLNVFEKNRRAIHFYERCGCKIVGTPVQLAEFPAIREIMMEKSLPD